MRLHPSPIQAHRGCLLQQAGFASSALTLSSPRPSAEEPARCQEELRETTLVPQPLGRQDWLLQSFKNSSHNVIHLFWGEGGKNPHYLSVKLLFSVRMEPTVKGFSETEGVCDEIIPQGNNVKFKPLKNMHQKREELSLRHTETCMNSWSHLETWSPKPPCVHQWLWKWIGL